MRANEIEENQAPAGLGGWIGRDWVSLCLFAWFVVAAYFVWDRWGSIHWLALGDTDDNMRLMQVRALLDGQGWYDLRQYRLNPPVGFDIHWSRIVDLPIAALILALKPFVGQPWAERIACGVAPLIPLAPVMVAVSFTVRRLVDRKAWPVAFVFVLGASAAMLMFMPMRIDHHGWQLACLTATVAGLADPRRGRGGAVVGLSSALSLAIGLEMLPYVAMAGAILGLRWVLDRDEAKRLATYGATLAGGVAAGYAGFASYANRVMRCDALTPVYLTAMLAAGAVLLALALVNPQRREMRFGLLVVAGAALAAGFALLFPQCLGRPEQVSPELAKNWLDNVREAKPIYAHSFRLGFTIAALPIVGLMGSFWAMQQARGSDRFGLWLSVTLFTAFACAMLLWQVRAGPAAQLLAVPGAAAVAWVLLPALLNFQSERPLVGMLVRVFGTSVAFLIISGYFAPLMLRFLPIDRPDERTKTVNRANARCMSLPQMRALNQYPAATILTFTDIGPRLITLTHHDAISGPYHRNGDAILDVQHAFQRDDATTRDVAKRHGASLVLVCPNMSESTVYRTRGKGGFYDRLAHNQVPAWLEPLPLPKGSAFRLFRIRD